MGFGFSAVNNAGEIVIDQDHYNPRAFKEGTLGVGEHEIAFPSSRDNPPLIAVKSAGNATGPYIMFRNIGMNAAETLYTDATLRVLGDAGTVSYVFYDELGGIKADIDYGMMVFDENGDTVFDSRQAYLEVMDIIQIPGDDPATSVYNHVSVPGAYYVLNSMTGNRIFWVQQIPNPPLGLTYFQSKALRQKTNTSVEVKHTTYFVGGTGPDPVINTDFGDGTLLVCRKIEIT